VPDSCPSCGHEHFETVDTRIEGRGALQTYAVRECGLCGTLWGEETEFAGVYDDE